VCKAYILFNNSRFTVFNIEKPIDMSFSKYGMTFITIKTDVKYKICNTLLLTNCVLVQHVKKTHCTCSLCNKLKHNIPYFCDFTLTMNNIINVLNYFSIREKTKIAQLGLFIYCCFQ